MIRLTSSAERAQYPYVWIDELNNKLYLCLPIASGTYVGLENTCQTTKETQKFFWGEQEENVPSAPSALTVLRKLQQDLEFDIALLKSQPTLSHVLHKKEERYSAVLEYIRLITDLESQSSVEYIKQRNTRHLPSTNTILLDKRNLFSILLRPAKMDSSISTEVHAVTFNRDNSPDSFYEKLNQSLIKTRVTPEKHIKDTVLDYFESLLDSNETYKLGQIKYKLRQALTHVIPSIAETEFDLNHSYYDQNEVINSRLLKEVLAVKKKQSPREKAGAIIDLAFNKVYWQQFKAQQVFESLKSDKDKLNLAIQYYISLINCYVLSQEYTRSDFAKIIESNAYIRGRLILQICECLENGGILEDSILDFIQSVEAFEISRPLHENEKLLLKKRFFETFTVVNEGAIFDEFLFYVPESEGLVFSFQNRISIFFSSFLQLENEGVVNTFIEERCVAISELNLRERFQNQLPHANHLEAYELNLTEREAIQIFKSLSHEHRARFLFQKTEMGNYFFEAVSSEVREMIAPFVNWDEVKIVCQNNEIDYQMIRESFVRSFMSIQLKKGNGHLMSANRCSDKPPERSRNKRNCIIM